MTMKTMNMMKSIISKRFSGGGGEGENEIIVRGEKQGTTDTTYKEAAVASSSSSEKLPQQSSSSLLLPSQPQPQPRNNDNNNLNAHAHAHQQLPEELLLPPLPELWPQHPLMVRPTPYSSTKIIGIRRATGDEYLKNEYYYCSRDDNDDLSCSSSRNNNIILPINNGKEDGQGNDDPLVIDFESEYFIGTLLLRIKDAPPEKREVIENESKRNTDSKHNNNYSDNNGDEKTGKGKEDDYDYFANKRRKFQCIIKGTFKKELPMNHIMTGQLFERSAGVLPSQWIVKSFLKIMSILAPQLDASLDGGKPRFLSPLVATAQTVVVEDSVKEDSDSRNNCHRGSRQHRNNNRNSIFTIIENDTNLEEPSSMDPTSILSDLRNEYSSDLLKIPDTTKSTIGNRMNVRKKIFNTLSANHKQQNSSSSSSSLEPCFSANNKIYTFEFYQHILDFSGNELTLEINEVGAVVPLSRVLDGQPLKILAVYEHERNDDNNNINNSNNTSDDVRKEDLDDNGRILLETLWSFDIFHESLYPYAQKAASSQRQINNAEQN